MLFDFTGITWRYTPYASSAPPRTGFKQRCRDTEIQRYRNFAGCPSKPYAQCTYKRVRSAYSVRCISRNPDASPSAILKAFTSMIYQGRHGTWTVAGLKTLHLTH